MLSSPPSTVAIYLDPGRRYPHLVALIKAQAVRGRIARLRDAGPLIDILEAVRERSDTRLQALASSVEEVARWSIGRVGGNSPQWLAMSDQQLERLGNLVAPR